jgi:Lamin Tail Domain
LYIPEPSTLVQEPFKPAHTRSLADSPFRGTIFINEVASTPTPDVGNTLCPYYEWIEFINTGSVYVDLTGFKIHDDRGASNPEAVVVNPGSFLDPGEISAICRFYFFQFDIDSSDTITFLDSNGNLVSTTGVLTNGGSATSTYQRTTNNTYKYGFPTFNSENFPIFRGSVVINEVASSPTIGACLASSDWIELFNAGDFDVDLKGFLLHDDKGPTDSEAFTFTNTEPLFRGQYYVICGLSQSFPSTYSFRFDIDSNDTGF